MRPIGVAFTSKGPTALVAVDTQALDCAWASGARKSAKQSDIGAQAKQHLVYRIAGTSQ